MNKEDIHSVKQYELFGPGIFIPNFELIERGMEAEMVVKMLFDTHQVKRFSCIEFDPNAPYPVDADQPYSWKKWRGTRNIEKLSRRIYNRSLVVFKFEGEDIYLYKILGLGSKVKVEGGAVKHMRMLDFDDDDTNVDINKIKDIGLPRGIVLKTDNSYHYYGSDLVSEDGWKYWIQSLIRLGGKNSFLGLPIYLYVLKEAIAPLGSLVIKTLLNKKHLLL